MALIKTWFQYLHQAEIDSRRECLLIEDGCDDDGVHRRGMDGREIPPKGDNAGCQ